MNRNGRMRAELDRTKTSPGIRRKPSEKFAALDGPRTAVFNELSVLQRACSDPPLPRELITGEQHGRPRAMS